MKQEFEYIVEQKGAGQPEKLVFLFHGYGLNAYVMHKLALQLLEDIPDVKVIMPHAPEPLMMPIVDNDTALRVPQQLLGKEAVLTEGLQWFDIANKHINEYRDPLYKLAGKLNKFIDEKRDEHGLKDKDIAIMGFSQGGAVAIYTAMLRDNPVSCLVAHSTMFLGGDSLQSQMPTLFIYGDEDEEFDDGMYQNVVEQLRDYMPLVEEKRIPNLSHKTNNDSRRETSAFIRKHLVD